MKKRFLAAVLALCFSVPVLSLAETVTLPRELYEKYKKLDELRDIMDIVQENYYEEIDEETLINGAAAGLLKSLDDPYTFYYSAAQFQDFLEHQNGEYAGIGIQISTSYTTGFSTISRVFAGSPAEEADVHRGDILVKVEDLAVTPDTIQDAVNIMRGTEGTEVEVTFLRGEETLVKKIGRAHISINRVESCMLDGIGYIRLWEFMGDCAQGFTDALDKLIKQGAKGIILDLRDNPGGILDDAISVSDHFLDEGILTYMVYRNGQRQNYYTHKGKLDIPVNIIVNENSASCSELVTGALRDRLGSHVIGKTSYGKGVVQHLLQVDEKGDAMQMTVAQYFTPNGTEVHKVGIAPDIEVALEEGDNGMYTLGDLTDPQLQAAYMDMKQTLGIP